MENKWKLDWKDKEKQRRALIETETTEPSSQGTSTLISQAKGLRRALSNALVNPPATGLQALPSSPGHPSFLQILPPHQVADASAEPKASELLTHHSPRPSQWPYRVP